jgi:hypothetical protein
LHKAVLPRTDVAERQGFRATTPLRTLLDVARGEISQEQLEKAITDALDRGLVRRSTLESLVRADATLRRLAGVLDGERTRAL